MLKVVSLSSHVLCMCYHSLLSKKAGIVFNDLFAERTGQEKDLGKSPAESSG